MFFFLFRILLLAPLKEEKENSFQLENLKFQLSFFNLVLGFVVESSHGRWTNFIVCPPAAPEVLVAKVSYFSKPLSLFDSQ